MKEFRVLVIDDDIRVIRRLKDRISPQHTVRNKSWNIVIDSLHVEIDENENNCFSNATLEQLMNVCSQQHDLILADFGFATSAQVDDLVQRKISPDDFMEKIRTLPDLIPAVEEYVGDKFPKDVKRYKQVQSDLRKNTCKLFLYTYTPFDLKDALPSVDARSKRTKNMFREAEVIPIDTLDAFFDGGKYGTNYEKDFYAYLVTGLLENIVRQELLLFILDQETERLKYIRYYRSGAGVLVIVILGGAIGAIGEWLGERIMGFAMQGLWTPAIIIIALATIIFFILGLFVPIIFEKLMSNLLRKFETDKTRLDA